MSHDNRYLVISADCHAAARWPDYEAYLEKRHLPAFRAWYGAGKDVATGRPGEDRLFATEFLDDRDTNKSVESGGGTGTWDPDRRIRELEADGVSGEVIFPGAENYQVPFHGRRPTSNRLEPQDPDLLQAGCQAYNRWLADLCKQYPERMAGVAVLSFHDIDRAVEEIRWAERAGLRGGILLPAEWDDLPSYNHPRYEPVWQACAELGVVVNSHPLGNMREAYGDLPGATGIFLSETKWFAHRPFTFLVWSGVFERHPELRFVLTEQMADWIPGTLEYFDDLYSRPIFSQLRDDLPLRPSEYWTRQCFVGASFMFPKETELRHVIGVEKIMWGSDYPHAEGTWPYTEERLRETFGGVSPDELRPMLGENAARIYGFDIEKLAPIAARVGPELEALA